VVQPPTLVAQAAAARDSIELKSLVVLEHLVKALVVLQMVALTLWAVAEVAVKVLLAHRVTATRAVMVVMVLRHHFLAHQLLTLVEEVAVEQVVTLVAVLALAEVVLVHNQTLAVKVVTSVWVALGVERQIKAVEAVVLDTTAEPLILEQQVGQVL
jgi:hypothetical protein